MTSNYYDWKPRTIDASPIPANMEQLRQIVREEVRKALKEDIERENKQVMEAINEPRDEQEEMAAVLAELSPQQLDDLIGRVRGRAVEATEA